MSQTFKSFEEKIETRKGLILSTFIKLIENINKAKIEILTQKLFTRITDFKIVYFIRYKSPPTKKPFGLLFRLDKCFSNLFSYIELYIRVKTIL